MPLHSLASIRALHRALAPSLLAIVAALSSFLPTPLTAQRAAPSAVVTTSASVTHDTTTRAARVAVPRTAASRWDFPTRFAAALTGGMLVGAGGAIAGSVARGECGYMCDPGNWEYVELGAVGGVLAGAALAAAIPHVGSPCTSFKRRLRATALGSAAGALAGVVASPVLAALSGGGKSSDAALWGAASGSVVGASLRGTLCRP